mmetsp:Transcript_12230/g.27921  ORF Transcript_12230/g.27921 Transcript_12230/m.27921 type:complete len:202 (+) Transcript_12230:568-1173(+)
MPIEESALAMRRTMAEPGNAPGKQRWSVSKHLVPRAGAQVSHEKTSRQESSSTTWCNCGIGFGISGVLYRSRLRRSVPFVVEGAAPTVVSEYVRNKRGRKWSSQGCGMLICTPPISTSLPLPNLVLTMTSISCLTASYAVSMRVAIGSGAELIFSMLSFTFPLSQLCCMSCLSYSPLSSKSQSWQALYAASTAPHAVECFD